jgi:beta-aspartyl-peptidase (threonine type)
MPRRIAVRGALCLALAGLAVPVAEVAGQVFGPRCRPLPPCGVEVLPCVPPVAAPAEAPAAAVRRVLDEQVAAWNRGDLEGFMAGYWPSPELSFYSGSTKTRGWQATLERYRKRYQSGGQEMGRLRFAEIEVDVLGAEHALVRGRWQLERKKDKPGGLFTLLFKRLPEGWRIVHDHTSS